MNLSEPGEFSDCLVFVDESGDHGMARVDTSYPMFVLAFCLLGKADYVERVCPGLQRLKFRFWGHDEQVLHEHEIRKPNEACSFLFDPAKRAELLTAISQFVEEAPFHLVAAAIRKLDERLGLESVPLKMRRAPGIAKGPAPTGNFQSNLAII